LTSRGKRDIRAGRYPKKLGATVTDRIHAAALTLAAAEGELDAQAGARVTGL
jgi:hypothetical protein